MKSKFTKISDRELIQLIECLDWMCCRCDTLYKFTLDPGYLLNGDPREVLVAAKEDLPVAQKILRKMMKKHYLKLINCRQGFNKK